MQIRRILAGAAKQVNDHAAHSNAVLRVSTPYEITPLPTRRRSAYGVIVVCSTLVGICLQGMYDVGRTSEGVDLPLLLLISILILAAIVSHLFWLVIAQRASLSSLATAVGLNHIDGMSISSYNSALSVADSLAQAIQQERLEHKKKHAELLDWQAAYAHDLRTPLTRMGLRCELLIDAKLRQSMERDLNEMCQLVEDSLACAKLQRGVSPQLSHVKVDELLGTLVENYRATGAIIGLKGCTDCSVIACHHGLRRVMTNLIDNALRYGTDVHIRVSVDAEKVALSVLDSGPGIEPSKLEAVLAPWYRGSDTAQRVSGSGLGLAIALRLTQAMQGKLHIQNRDSGGLEACVTLPIMTE